MTNNTFKSPNALGYPFLKKHVDGPVLLMTDGRMHWLTWRERFALWIGHTTIEEINARYLNERDELKVLNG